MSNKILANMVHMQYHLRKYHDAVIPQVSKPKWNADWIIVLMMNLSSTNYACSEHVDFGQYDQYALPWQDNTMLRVSCKFGVRKLNPYRVNLLTS